MNIENFPKGRNLIYSVEIEETNYQKALKYLHILSDEEINRWSSFKFEQHKIRYLVSRVALRSILSLYTKIPSRNIRFALTSHGKPYLVDFLGLYFNLSHSHKKTLIAISQYQIGIDIEYFNTQINYLGIVNHFFSIEEYNFIQNQKNHLTKYEIFFKLWTQKEALLKALGIGLFGNTKAINFGKFDRLDKSFAGFEPKDWMLRSLKINDDAYVGAVAYKIDTPVEFKYNVWLF